MNKIIIPKIGDEIRYVGEKLSFLTLGKTYIVIDIIDCREERNEPNDIFYEVKDDNGGYINKYHFKFEIIRPCVELPEELFKI